MPVQIHQFSFWIHQLNGFLDKLIELHRFLSDFKVGRPPSTRILLCLTFILCFILSKSKPAERLFDVLPFTVLTTWYNQVDSEVDRYQASATNLLTGRSVCCHSPGCCFSFDFSSQSLLPLHRSLISVSLFNSLQHYHDSLLIFNDIQWIPFNDRRQMVAINRTAAMNYVSDHFAQLKSSRTSKACQ